MTDEPVPELLCSGTGLISDQVRMMRATASRTRTSDDIKASDHTTRTAPSGNSVRRSRQRRTYECSSPLGACGASSPITASSANPTVRLRDLAQAARSPG